MSDEKSDDKSELSTGYQPAEVEPKWYEFWLENGVFEAGVEPGDKREPYAITMPPPNVTGSLHMGHAYMVTLEDVLIRHKRMQGRNTLWQPGIDHAGIATQLVVERQLAREGKSRHDLGRAKFVERVWEWKAQSGGRIAEQMRVLGASPDWDRSKFTMDPDMQAAVREAFVRLHGEGLIYRATRLINWCTSCRTALSDVEVENEEANGELYEFAYPVIDADAAAGATELVVATTRPETMLGDTAVAVHPDDPRYKHLHGKKLKHPFLAREIPVITDAILVDMAFGTGAVKVTPGHDFNDFATGKRHKLEEINILNLDGTLNEQGAQFQGLNVKQARTAVKKALAEAGLERATKAHKLQLPRCTRSNTVVEPIISTQWFVDMKPLAEPALAAVREKRTELIPAEWEKTYEHFLTNIQDWCISRQLWWGHQIPAFHCADCGHITVTREDHPSACEKCKKSNLTQDPDVLDTWFSSGLWPFSTLGWPNKTTELERFYPTSDLETGYDILFFWVARMMMLGLHFMGEVPFRRVLLHGMIVDETGDKMGKLKGNTLDPVDLIYGADFSAIVQKTMPDAPVDEALAKFRKAYPSSAQMGKGFAASGADALRFTLCSYSPQAKRIALSPARVDGYRKFCNKIYNATRFSLTYLEGQSVTTDGVTPTPKLLVNRWILSRLGHAASASTRGIDNFRLDDGSSALYHFFWDEFCAWFVEMTKPVFLHGTEPEKAETRRVLAHALEAALRGLHPYAPFITEDLWQRIPRPASRPVSIALSPYPTAADGRADLDAERDMTALMAVIGAARTVRSEHEIAPSDGVKLELRSRAPKLRALLEEQSRFVTFLVRTEGAPTVVDAGGARPKGAVLTVAGEVDVLVNLRGLVDPAKEKERVERKLKKIQKDLEVMEKRLTNANFLKNAPPEVVVEANAQKQALEREQVNLSESLKWVDELKE
ncbi:MAG TPA: valine--tRNA ligase [Polyangiaceae bacterium]|nr:valine--tRNA ligase [Polyangiaceae bacterium]